MPPRLLVGVGQASEGAEARDYLVELLAGLAPLGVGTQVALLGRGRVRADLGAVADVRLMPAPRPRSPAGLTESIARRVDAGLAERIHSTRTRGRRRWIRRPDGVHLNGPEAAPLLRDLRAVDVPVTTYVHPHDFNIAGLQPADRERLLARTDRFLVADQATGDDLVANGADRSRIQLAPPVILPTRPVGRSVHAAARTALGLPVDGFVIGTPPVPGWIDGPDLTLALAWELERRRSSGAPWTYWDGMPTDAARRWPVQYDVERMGLSRVVVGGDLRPSIDLLDLVDLVVLPTHTTAPVSPLFVRHAAAHGTPVLCWSGHDLAEEVRRWTGGVVDQPDVATMAERVLHLAEDAAELTRIGDEGRRAAATEIERIVPLRVPVP